MPTASLADSPISHSNMDLFDFGHLVHIISERLERNDSTTSDTIALYGPWGSGKSSVFRLVRKELPSRFVWIDFDALRFQSHGNVVLPLLHRVAESAPAVNRGFVQPLLAAATEVVKDFVPAGKYLAPLVGPMFNVNPQTGLPESPASVVEKRFRELIALYLNHGCDHVVVAIDNLDRCQPSAVIQMIEAIHLLLNAPGVSFLIAVDQDALLRFVNGRYEGTNNEAAMYLEKVFPDYYRIPTPWTNSTWGPSHDPVRRYLTALVRNPECRKVAKYIKAMWSIVSFSQALKNPRRIKRLIRRLSLIQSAKWPKESKTFVGFFFLVALSDIWPHAYRAFFYADPEEWQDTIDWMVGFTEENKDDGESEVRSVEGGTSSEEFRAEKLNSTEAKLRELGRDEALVEFVVSTSQCFCPSTEFDTNAHIASIVRDHGHLWSLLGEVATIGL